MICRVSLSACAGWMRRHGHAAFLMLLGGCASLPDVSYLRERELVPRNPPTIVTPRGELGQEKSQALLDRMTARVGATDILERHIAAEEAIAGSPLIGGNKVTLLADGPETMRAMLGAIRSARNHVHLETYIIEDDEVGRALADLLIQKSAAGVKVNLIHDSVGTLGTPKEYFERLRAAGIETLEYNPVNPLAARRGWDLNQRDHRKILVVDGRIAFTGGVNISRVYGKSSRLGSRGQEPPTKDPKEAAWRDTHMQIEGPVVAEFQKMFLDTWQRKAKTPIRLADFFPRIKPDGRALVRAIGTVAESNDYSIYKTYISAFANASSMIHLTVAYFAPDRQIVKALTDAARRGVEVRIIFPSFSDHGIMLHANRSYYQRLLDAGIKVYERQGAMLHAKTAVIDDVWSTIGSTNLDNRSFIHNDEVNAIVLDPDFASRMESLFQLDLRESVEITADRWRERGAGKRLREWTVRLFSYWL